MITTPINFQMTYFYNNFLQRNVRNERNFLFISSKRPRKNTENIPRVDSP